MPLHRHWHTNMARSRSSFYAGIFIGVQMFVLIAIILRNQPTACSKCQYGLFDWRTCQSPGGLAVFISSRSCGQVALRGYQNLDDERDNRNNIAQKIARDATDVIYDDSLQTSPKRKVLNVADNTTNSYYRSPLLLYPRRNGETMNIGKDPEFAMIKYIGEKADASFDRQNAIIANRTRIIRALCKTYSKLPYWKKLHTTGVVLSYSPYELNYCVTPKVGCTFWKRIMRFLAGDFSNSKIVKRPSDINRFDVHYGQINNLDVYHLGQNQVQQTMVSRENAFMFARDPYTRLWSAYIDKLLLPDFWKTDGLNIVRFTRHNISSFESKCGYNVTFAEFLKYVNHTRDYMNEHWMPVHRICSPCHVNFDVIGKLETFGTDSDFILTKFGLHHLKENQTALERVYSEIDMLISYNFGVKYMYKKNDSCFDEYIIAKRLWQAFQLNGYIHVANAFPEEKLSDIATVDDPESVFAEAVYDVVEAQRGNLLDLKPQRRALMVEAYKHIPSTIMKAIQSIYDYDFELFGYDRAPHDLYSHLNVETDV